MRLRDAHDAVFNPPRALAIHLLLLSVELADHEKLMVLTSAECAQPNFILQLCNNTQVPRHKPQLLANRLAKHPRTHTTLFGHCKIRFACLLTVRPWLALTAFPYCMQDVNDFLQFLTRLVEQRQICRIGDVCWSSRRVQKEFALVTHLLGILSTHFSRMCVRLRRTATILITRIIVVIVLFLGNPFVDLVDDVHA